MVSGIIQVGSHAEYPKLLRAESPMLLRSGRFSLTVGSVTFSVKVKYGQLFKGFSVFASGLGTPVYEVNHTEIQADNDDPYVIEQIKDEAEDWLNALSNSIYDAETSDPVKAAVDRLCWQMHYDITGDTRSYTDSEFSGNIEILESGNGTTVNTLSVQSTALTTATISVGTNISTMNTDFNNSSSGTIIELKSVTNKIATNLRADAPSSGTQEYTISKALRDLTTDDDSVAYSVKQQTELEEENFNEISVNQLGAFGTTNSHRSLYDAIGSYAESGNDTVSNTLDTVSDNIGSSSDSSGTGTVFARLTQVSDSKLGSFGDSSHRTLQESLGSYTGNSSGNKSLSDIVGTNADGSSQTNTGTLFYEILHRAGTRDLNTAQIQSDSPFGKVLAAIDSIASGSSGQSTTINTISSNVTTILNRIGTSSTSGTLWNDVNYIKGSVTDQVVNGATFRVSRSTLPLNYDQNTW